MRKYRIGFISFLATLLVAFVAGCGQETVTLPSVVSVTPAQGAAGVAVSTAITATFSEAMNPASITATTFTVAAQGGAAVTGTVAYSGSVATFTPGAALAFDTTYTATITTGAATPGGAELIGPYVWSFTTISSAPAVVSTAPANGALNVPVGQVLTATFSEAMTPASISATTFTLQTTTGGVAVAGTVTYSGLVATFTPTASLAYSTGYTATITTGATDLAGTPLAANYVWTFTTITPPPVVIATVPVNTATLVPVTQVLSATFNEAMNCAAFPATAFTVTGPGVTPVPGTIGCAGAVATFTPAASLAFNTLYTATITTGATDLAGTPLASKYVWTFLTLPAPALPTVIATVPVNGAVNVPFNQALTAAFSVAMNPATIDAATFTLKSTISGTAVTGVVTYVAAGSIATFTPSAPLAATTEYTATITTGAMDTLGNSLAHNYNWTFTTAALPAAIQPTVISTIPQNLATLVPLNQIVSAIFSVPMTPATITTITPPTFTLTYVPTAGGAITPVAGLVAYAAVGNTLTFTPAANLLPSTTYTATITTGAQDLAGTPMASNYVWTFTTGTTVAAVPPVLDSTVPVNAAISVPLDQAVSATFSKAMNPLTFTSTTYYLSQGLTTIGTTISLDPTNTIATLTPTAPLTASTIYTVTVTDGVTDATGNPLANTGAPDPWTFTTAATPPPPPPIVLGPTISLFGAFGGGAGITNQGLFTVVNADIGTTGASTKITGFHDDSIMALGLPQCTYSESTAPPATGLVGAASVLGTGVITIFTAPGTSQPTTACPDEASGPATLPGTTAYIAQQAATEALAAYNTLQCGCNPAAGTTPSGVIGASLPSNLGGKTLAPGTWTNASTVEITGGDLTLDAKGDPNAYWIFQIGTTLTVGDAASPQSVILINGAKAANVYWAVGSAATINYGGGGTMVGTIISTAATTLSSPAQSTTTSATTFLTGRAVALNASTTMVNTIVNLP